MIRLVELFAGIGAQTTALKRAGIDHETVSICEIDKYAAASYKAIHGDVPNLGDITKVKELPECDLLTYSFPCQALSVAGLREGMEKGSGTSSSLLWEVERLLTDMKARGVLHKVLVMENVVGIHGKKNMANFQKWIDTLTLMGYTSSWADFKASDYGIPQTRVRCIMVSRLDGVSTPVPTPTGCTKVLRDFMEPEENVDEIFYLSEEQISTMERHKERNKSKGNGFGYTVCDPSGMCNTLLTNPSKSGCNLVKVGQLHVQGRYESAQRIYSPDGACPTLVTRSGGGLEPKIEVDGRIRKLTPREFWRLMGFSDEAFDEAAKVCSNTQLYKQAGNSIVVDVLTHIFKTIYTDKSNPVGHRIKLLDEYYRNEMEV